MPRELKNAKITHVSYVDKGANKRRFFMTKAEDAEPTFEKEVRLLIKADDAQRLVYGIVYEPDAIDAHGDFMTSDEIEKAAHDFMAEARNIDKQHNFESGAGEVVESYIAPTDMYISGELIKKGTWVLVTKATEDIWKSIQSGEITGYSMAGTAETVQKAEDDEYRSFFKMLKDFFTGKPNKIVEEVNEVEKHENEAEVLEKTEAEETVEATEEVEKAGKAISAKNMAKLQQAHDILAELVANGVIDAEDAKDGGADEASEDKSVKKELTDVLSELLAPINDRLAKLESTEEVEKEAPSEEEVTTQNDELRKMLADVVKEALEPINSRLEVVEKSRGISRQAENNVPVVKKETKSETRKSSIWDF